jgi:hypothetical protein
MKRGDVTVPERLLPAGMLRDALNGQIHFDETLGVMDHN